MPTDEWMERYRTVKEQLACKVDLDAYFTEDAIADTKVVVLDMGAVRFPTGSIIACAPLVSLEDARPYLQTVPAGTYPLKICVVPSDEYGDRYACAKVELSDRKPIRYELAMVGDEDLDDFEDGVFFGFFVDAGMACVADAATQEAFRAYWAARLEKDDSIDPYNDLFCDLLEESAREHPEYQGEYGDRLIWTIPGTECDLPIFAAGWGDGVYPVYFGYDASGEVSGVYVHLIDIAESYRDPGDGDGPAR